MDRFLEAIIWGFLCAVFVAAARWAAELGTGWATPFVILAVIDGYFAIRAIVEMAKGDD